MLEKVFGPPLASAGRNVAMRFETAHRVNSQIKSLRLAVRAELIGSSTACACGITGRGNAPVLDLIRKLLASGHDPDQPLEAFRDSTLCLTIRSIGQAAELRVNPKGTDFVKGRSGVPTASPMRSNGGGHHG